MRRWDPRNLSLRAKLVGLVAAVVGGVVVVLFVTLPSRMDELSRAWTERRAEGIATVLASSVAPGLEFNDAASVAETLTGLAAAADAAYGAVYRSDGTLVAAWNGDRVDRTRGTAAPTAAHFQDRNGLLQVDVPVRAKGGTTGTLRVGFALEALSNEMRRNLRAAAALAAALLGVGLVASFAIGTWLVRPLVQIRDLTLRIAGGDLSPFQIRAGGRDEIGRMSDAFQRMCESQRALVRRISETSAQLAGAAAEIYAASQEQEVVAAQQSAAVEEANRTMSSLLDSASHISESADGVLANAERTRETTEHTSGKIAELSSHTGRIGEILDRIRDIADRSDLLALNASLEATRAGEAGRGFALVAAEMRRLAERVTASVADVKTLVDDIRAFGSSSVLATEESRKLAEGTTESARQITLVTQQQRSATEQVSQGTKDIAAVLAQSVEATRQTKALAEDLKRQADSLAQIVGSFRFNAPSAP